MGERESEGNRGREREKWVSLVLEEQNVPSMHSLQFPIYNNNNKKHARVALILRCSGAAPSAPSAPFFFLLFFSPPSTSPYLRFSPFLCNLAPPLLLAGNHPLNIAHFFIFSKYHYLLHSFFNYKMKNHLFVQSDPRKGVGPTLIAIFLLLLLLLLLLYIYYSIANSENQYILFIYLFI